MNTKHDKDYDAPKGILRRSFMARGVAVGAAAGAAEREKSYPGVKLISLAAPSGVRGERSRPVHANDYLYKRSISGSEQPTFAHERPPLSRDLLERADGNLGQAILHQIQQDLATTCEFQPSGCHYSRWNHDRLHDHSPGTRLVNEPGFSRETSRAGCRILYNKQIESITRGSLGTSAQSA